VIEKFATRSGGDGVVEFVVQGLPKLQTNSYAGWRIRHTEKRRWEKRVWEAVIEVGRPREAFKKATVEMVRCSTTMPDYDNLAASMKPLLDGLVKARVILDDNPDVIGHPKFGWELTKRGQGCVRVRVEGIE